MCGRLITNREGQYDHCYAQKDNVEYESEKGGRGREETQPRYRVKRPWIHCPAVHIRRVTDLVLVIKGQKLSRLNSKD